MRTHYQVLGLHKSFTPEELKATWRSLTSALHPDRLGNTVEANARFAEVTGAYAVLSDPRRKQEYDKVLSITALVCSACQGEGCVYKGRGFTKRVAVACKTCDGTGLIF